MNGISTASLRPLAPGIVLALTAILFGFGLGGVFGAAEESMKEHLKASAESVLASAYGGDVGKMDAVVKKSWSYMKRAHLHGGAIGAAALGSILLLAALGGRGPVERASSVAFGAGALLYSMFWLFAALKAPALGSTGAAKESLEFMAIPGAGLCILGLCGTLLSIIRTLFARDIEG